VETEAKTLRRRPAGMAWFVREAGHCGRPSTFQSDDRAIVHDGPATDANRFVRESLALPGNLVSVPTPEVGTAIRTS
jgi:hypothetical protein